MDTQSCIKDGVSDIDEGSAQSTPAGPRGKMWYMARPPHAHAYVSTSPCACPLFLRPSCPTSLPRTSCTPSIQITSPIPAPPPAAPTASALRTRTIPYTLSCLPAPLGRRVPPFLRTLLG
ncbi:hypothetical protein C8J57DRAFT_1506374 [Mycena rebaudengoi]|nr:hypothetical protein C8J57DRAFT_1506374 [Mycena rebaudengoi]